MTAHSIVIRDLWKQYRIGQVRPTDTFYETLARMIRNPFGASRHHDASGTSNSTFWALGGIDLDVAQGEVLGVIGRNGAGKSTLLKVLSRITEPTRGRVEIRGRLASLLEVGTGFHPELTGRENIFLNGAILGMSRGEIRSKFDEIVAFAEVEKFVDTPVKRYSSGMYVRLAFAVAAHLDADVLLVDEVLAVGDVEFQEKCLGRMREVSGEGRTVLFVSHNMGMIGELCNRCVLLSRGTVEGVGTPQAVIHEYFARRDTIESFAFQGALAADIRVDRLAINGSEASAGISVRPTDEIRLLIEGHSRRSFDDVVFALTLSSQGTRLLTLHDVEGYGPLREGRFRVAFSVPPALLRPGDFVVGFGADRSRVGGWMFADNLTRITVLEEWSAGCPANRRGLINLTPEQVTASRTTVLEDMSGPATKD